MGQTVRLFNQKMMPICFFYLNSVTIAAQYSMPSALMRYGRVQNASADGNVKIYHCLMSSIKQLMRPKNLLAKKMNNGGHN